MLAADEHISITGVTADLNTPQDYRDMFLGAIQIQRDNITQAENMIKHYEYALSEMAKQEEPVNDNMLKLCEAIVEDLGTTA